MFDLIYSTLCWLGFFFILGLMALAYGNGLRSDGCCRRLVQGAGRRSVARRGRVDPARHSVGADERDDPQSDERDRLRKQADETFRGLPLLTKPLGEATAMKLVALLLAGIDAHAKSLLEQEGKLEPDKFLPMVSAYCLRDDNESSEFGEAAKDFVKKL